MISEQDLKNMRTEIIESLSENIAMVLDQVVKNWNRYYDEKTAMKEEIKSLKRELAEIKGIPLVNGVLSEG